MPDQIDTIVFEQMYIILHDIYLYVIFRNVLSVCNVNRV